MSYDGGDWRPGRINILGKTHKIRYHKKMGEVDPDDDSMCWGVINYKTREIHIYDGEPADRAHSLCHEILHAVAHDMQLAAFNCGSNSDDEGHRDLDRMALALSQFLIQNRLV